MILSDINGVNSYEVWVTATPPNFKESQYLAYYEPTELKGAPVEAMTSADNRPDAHKALYEYEYGSEDTPTSRDPLGILSYLAEPNWSAPLAAFPMLISAGQKDLMSTSSGPGSLLYLRRGEGEPQAMRVLGLMAKAGNSAY